MATFISRATRTVFTVMVLMMILVLALVGCATIPASSEPDPKASAASTETTEPQPEATVEPAEPVQAATEDEYLKLFGEVITYADGVSVSVSPGTEFQPSATAVGQVSGQPSLLFTVVITNNSDEKIEPMAFSSVTSGGVAASLISDIANPEHGEIGLPPMVTLLPGQTIKWLEAYSVADVNDITYQINPTMFAYEDAIFVVSK